MNLSATPNTPVHTPQPRSSTKGLQLTPIWEEIVKNNRLPPDVDQDLVFNEIAVRLEDLEWPVRQHAFRVLYDIIPVIPKEHLDERILQNNIFRKLVVNLGHPAPGIRKVASETIQKYLKRTPQTEKMLEDFLQYGVKEREVVSNNQTGILRENITLGTIVTLIDVLKPFIIPENGGYSLSQSFLGEVVQALAEKTKNSAYREKSVDSLWKIRELVGESRFQRTLASLPEREHVEKVMNPRNDNNWSSENSFNVLASQDSFDMTQADCPNPGKDGSSEEFSDGTDTETYTKEPAPNLNDIYYHVNRAEVSHYMSPSFVPIEHSDNFLPRIDAKENEEVKDSGSSSPRVVLEAEIQFAKNKAITMKVVEDENRENQVQQPDQQTRFVSENGDLVMKVLPNSEGADGEEKTRTPRRVRFGGEVIKLRTPDSDTTDITIEIHDGGSTGNEPTITITPDPVKPEQKTPEPQETQSQLPVASAALPKGTRREASPSRRAEGSRMPVPKEGCLSPKSDSCDSTPSSSGSDGDGGNDEEEGWRWAELRLVEENILKDLRNKENWKIQYQALEQLKVVLAKPKTIEKIEKMRNQEKLFSLFKCFLYNLPQSNNQQVTILALSIVTQLIETLPKEVVLLDVADIVQGLCKYVGGCKNLNLKIEAVQSLKMLLGVLEPSAVIDVLIGEGCLQSSSSKLRENSLLAILYATMTFPSDVFDMEKILGKVAAAVADTRRRVRHAALEAVAVLSQFCSSQTLTDSVARAAETMSTPAARTQLIAAVQARLSRRLLPTISSEGLVLYALQIPASRRFGHLGDLTGADVDWILSGSGSVSTGSAKSKTQLNAAQRLKLQPTTSLSPKKWAQSERSPKSQLVAKPTPGDNPWKIQKHRTESSVTKSTNHSASFYKTQSTGNLSESDKDFFIPNITADSEKRLRPEEITWALIPISALDEPLLGRERSNSLWGEPLDENTPHYPSPPFGPLRPMYLKLHPAQDHLILSRSSEDVRKISYPQGGRKQDTDDFTKVRLLTPTVLREKNYSENYYKNEKTQRHEVRTSGDMPTRIPVLCSNNARNAQRVPRSSLQYHGNDRKISDTEETTPGIQKPTKLNNGCNGFPRSPAFLPDIHTGHDTNYNLQKSSTPNKYEDVDEVKLQDTMTQLSGLLSASKTTGKTINQDFYSIKEQSDVEINGNDNFQLSEAFDNKIQNKLELERSYLKNHSALPNTVTSAPAVVSSDSRDQIPSTSSSNSTDFGSLGGTELRARRLAASGPGALDESSGPPHSNYATYNSKFKGKKPSETKSLRKVGINENSFPANLKPFERPKEGLDTCFNQLESQQWEVNMLGLTSLVRLLRHHPAMVLGQLHPVTVALGRHIRNLRSQVARVACQASAEMFLALKRNVEPDLEELSGPLFHRSADTNRFIRADCNNALDNMIDNVGHAKAVTVIISKGTNHQNATVRTVAARLLLRLSEKSGAEKLLSLPKETREKMLQAGANLLTEGKLETRAFAKQVFRVWSSHPSFSNLILEAVQPNVMRNITKTLISLKS